MTIERLVMDLKVWTSDICQRFPFEVRKSIMNYAFREYYDIDEYLLFLIKHADKASADPLIVLLQLSDLLVLYFGNNKLAFYRSECIEEWEVLKLYSFSAYQLKKFESLLRNRKVRIGKVITRNKYAKDDFKLCGQYLHRLPRYGEERTAVDYEFDLKESFYDQHVFERKVLTKDNIHYSYTKFVHIKDFEKSWLGANNRKMYYDINVVLHHSTTFQKFKSFLEDKINKGFSHNRVKYNVKVVIGYTYRFGTMSPSELPEVLNYFNKHKSFVSEFKIHLVLCHQNNISSFSYYLKEDVLKYIKILTIYKCDIEFYKKDKQWLSKLINLNRVVIGPGSSVNDISSLHSVKRIDLYDEKMPYKFLIHGIPRNSVDVILLKNAKLEYLKTHERRLRRIFARPDEVSGYIDYSESYIGSTAPKKMTVMTSGFSLEDTSIMNGSIKLIYSAIGK
jgi:hypothetical protein